MRLTIPALLSLTTAAIVSGCGGPTHWVEESRPFEIDVTGIERIACTTHNGDIRSRVDPQATRITITADVHGGGVGTEDAKRALDAIEVVRDTDGGALSLGWSWRDKPDANWGARVHFDVVVPRAMPLRATTHNGSIDAEAGGACELDTHNGSLRIRGQLTELSVSSHNGDITVDATFGRIDAASHNGALQIRRRGGGPLAGRLATHNGDVSIALGAGSAVRIDARTDNDAITSTLRLRDARAEDGELAGALGDGGGTLQISTHNGAIRLTDAAGS